MPRCGRERGASGRTPIGRCSCSRHLRAAPRHRQPAFCPLAPTLAGRAAAAAGRGAMKWRRTRGGGLRVALFAPARAAPSQGVRCVGGGGAAARAAVGARARGGWRRGRSACFLQQGARAHTTRTHTPRAARRHSRTAPPHSVRRPADPPHSLSAPRASARRASGMGSKKESALDLGRFIDKEVRVKLTGGREGTSSGSWGGGGGGGCAMGPPAVADAARRAQQREHCGRTAALRSSER